MQTKKLRDSRIQRVRRLILIGGAAGFAGKSAWTRREVVSDGKKTHIPLGEGTLHPGVNPVRKGRETRLGAEEEERKAGKTAGPE